MLANALRLPLVLFAVVVASDAQAADTPEAFRKFAEQHCVSCHGPDVQRGHLRLDTLPTTLADKDNAATWVKVFDRVSRGEMPPKSKERPPEKETQAILASLKTSLHDASLAKQQAEGRVVLRRLNRIEYETTLRDLLGKHVEVKELLPDDNIAAGFDNVSAVLDVSSTHLLRYQDAAEKALAGVIPTKPQFPFTERRTGKQVTEKVRGFPDLLGKVVKLDGDTLVMYVRQWGHVPCATPTVRQPGRYRVKASVYAVGTDKPLPMLMSCREEYGREDNDVRGVRDIPPGKPTLVEGEFDMKPRQVIVFTGWSLPRLGSTPTLGKEPIEKYAGPGLAVEWVEIEGPIDAWPGVGYERLFGGVPLEPASVARLIGAGQPVPPQPKRNADAYIYDPLVPVSKTPREDAERLMKAFLPQAFRRPVSVELQDYYVKMVHAALDKKLPFADAMLLGYKAALCSPHFLFLTEAIDVKSKNARLDPYAVASRLSYFLWSSMPDAELYALAAKGELTKPEVLRAQTERMLKDPKAQRFTQNFAGQWLELRNINATSPDPQIYGEFDDFLFWSMPQETQRFFDEILRADLSVANFVHSDWSFLNQRLAQHYGINDVVGGELRKVTLPKDSHRGGVLTQAAILKVTADGTRTSPVLRGKWVLERIIGQPPAPPPPDIPSIEPDIRGATTIRQQLDKHRNTPACASCHVHIDPPGFALETFDVIGGWRDFYRGTRGTLVDLANYPTRKIFRGLDVEKGGITPDGKPFKSIDDYKQVLLADKDQLARNLAQKLVIYSTGADIQFADRAVIEELVAKAREKNYGFRSLLHEVVQSRVFLNK